LKIFTIISLWDYGIIVLRLINNLNQLRSTNTMGFLFYSGNNVDCQPQKFFVKLTLLDLKVSHAITEGLGESFFLTSY
jgi:hypothetical protein